MNIRFEDCSVFDKKELIFNNGLNFYITQDKEFQGKVHRFIDNRISETGNIYIDQSKINIKDFRKIVYYINQKEKGIFLRNRKYKSAIKPDSEIAKLFGIHTKVFDLKFRQLWHWSYLCSCACAIKKGKTALIFPWIDGLECAIQTYRFAKLFEYSKQHEMIVIIPTDNVEKMKNDINYAVKKNTIFDLEYNVID